MSVQYESSGVDSDVEIINEEIPNNSANLLVSKVKKEKESDKNTTVSKGSKTSESTLVNDTADNEALQKLSPLLNLDSMGDVNIEYGQSTVLDVNDLIQNKKVRLNLSNLSSIGNMNIHDFFKSTPMEIFSRKGFYSCTGCSSKFTSSELYNFHIRRKLGEFSFPCEICKVNITVSNQCQMIMHFLTMHKTANVPFDKVEFKTRNISTSPSTDSISEVTNEKELNFEEIARKSIKKVIENQSSRYSIDLFRPFKKAPKDQRYYLLPMARRDVVQTHKFYSDHFRAAKQKLKDQPVELLHCFMCDYVTDSHQGLISHLQGEWPFAITKCAFCNLALPLNKKNNCAAKAHVLYHMGIFLMCPRCGFVPPPDLNPDDFEITLRLHLRFVCYHFNSIQIYVCPACSDSKSRAFNSQSQLLQHIYDDHLKEIRTCMLCATSGSESNNNETNCSANGSNMRSDLQFNLDELRDHAASVHNRLDFETFFAEGKLQGKCCEHCTEIILSKENYCTHVLSSHKSTIVKGRSAFRCFGTCKRIHQSIDDFQHHRADCSQCISVKNKLYQPHFANISPESISLCFCLYCGIGIRKKKLGNDETETHSEPQMFANLHLTHKHEKQHTVNEVSNTACPWCSYKMSSKISAMIQHMEIHFSDNWFLSWYAERNKNYKKEPSGILYCYCLAAIDNPLSLHCHCIPQNLMASLSANSNQPVDFMQPLLPPLPQTPVIATSGAGTNINGSTVNSAMTGNNSSVAVTFDRQLSSSSVQLNGNTSTSGTPPATTTTTATTATLGAGHLSQSGISSPNFVSATHLKHVALSDTIHREFLIAPRHKVTGFCKLCINISVNSSNTNSTTNSSSNTTNVNTSSNSSFSSTNQEIFSNTLELSWHMFIKHRNIVCYVCKNFRLLNADNGSQSRVTMWNHIYSCIRNHTPRFNIETGLYLLENIANCQTAMENCTVFDVNKMTVIRHPKSAVVPSVANAFTPASVMSTALIYETPKKDVDKASSPQKHALSQHLGINIEITELSDTCSSSAETVCAKGQYSVTNLTSFNNENQSTESSKIPSNRGSPSNYECGYCKIDSERLANDSKIFEVRSDLYSHLLECHGVDMDKTSGSYADYLCYVCGLKFDKADMLEDHILASHSKGFRRMGLDLLNTQLVVMDSDHITYRCYLCNQRFEKMGSCEIHMAESHNMVHNEINWGMLTDTIDSARRNKSSINSSSVCLTNCPPKRLRLCSPSSLQKYSSQLSSGGKDSNCSSHYNTTFTNINNNNTNTNITSTINSPLDPYVCALCPFESSIRSKMAEHAVKVHNQRGKLDGSITELLSQPPDLFICPDCSLSFRTAHSRNIHMAFIHKRNMSDTDKELETTVVMTS